MGTAPLIQYIWIKVYPGVKRVELSHFWQFEFIFKLDKIWIFFSGLVEALGGQLTAVSYT